MDVEEQRLELIEDLLSCSSVDEMATQEAVGVLLRLSQDADASFATDATQVSDTKLHHWEVELSLMSTCPVQCKNSIKQMLNQIGRCGQQRSVVGNSPRQAVTHSPMSAIANAQPKLDTSAWLQQHPAREAHMLWQAMFWSAFASRFAFYADVIWYITCVSGMLLSLHASNTSYVNHAASCCFMKCWVCTYSSKLSFEPEHSLILYHVCCDGAGCKQ